MDGIGHVPAIPPLPVTQPGGARGNRSLANVSPLHPCMTRFDGTGWVDASLDASLHVLAYDMSAAHIGMESHRRATQASHIRTMYSQARQRPMSLVPGHAYASGHGAMVHEGPHTYKCKGSLLAQCPSHTAPTRFSSGCFAPAANHPHPHPDTTSKESHGETAQAGAWSLGFSTRARCQLDFRP